MGEAEVPYSSFLLTTTISMQVIFASYFRFLQYETETALATQNQISLETTYEKPENSRSNKIALIKDEQNQEAIFCLFHLL